jgi:predicted RNase H-like nuclease
LLDREIAGVEAALACLDAAANGVALKAYEDALDAIVCAWVGVCALEGRATPLGNELSAIWVPRLMRALPRHLSGVDTASIAEPTHG